MKKGKFEEAKHFVKSRVHQVTTEARGDAVAWAPIADLLPEMKTGDVFLQIGDGYLCGPIASPPPARLPKPTPRIFLSHMPVKGSGADDQGAVARTPGRAGAAGDHRQQPGEAT